MDFVWGLNVEQKMLIGIEATKIISKLWLNLIPFFLMESNMGMSSSKMKEHRLIWPINL
jgi:hypothetical protein